MAVVIRLMATMGLAGLTACTTGIVDPVREVPGAPELVSDRLVQGARRLGLGQPSSASAAAVHLDLPNARTNWTSCPPMLVSGGDDTRRMATASRRWGEVDITLAPVPTGTQVAVRSRFMGLYRNPITGYSFETSCESTGELEEGLLEAAAGG
jgi:hypothetical protein